MRFVETMLTVGVAVTGFALPTLAGGPVPEEVTLLTASREANDVRLEWAPAGGAAGYRVYRAQSATGLGFLGDAPAEEWTDFESIDDTASYFYLVSAVAADGTEGPLRPGTVTAAPVLSRTVAGAMVTLDWTAARGSVAGYRVVWGVGSRHYTEATDVGSASTFSLNLTPNVPFFFRVASLDADGSVIHLSNEVNAHRGIARVRANDGSRLCPSYGGCAVQDGEIPRYGGQEMIAPVDFPEGDWTKVLAVLTVESQLCGPPIASNKCGQGNAGGWDGWNPCGDPWDRTASLTLVRNDCIAEGTGCHGNAGNIELIHAVTAFGTDAEPPMGSGVIEPTVWTFDITPYAPLLTGRGHVSAFIATWVPPGWLASVDFEFYDAPGQASDKPPADGIATVWYGGSTPPGPTSVTVPATATEVYGRVFTTGHGGVGNPPCDEFCVRNVEISVDGIPEWTDSVWRTCSSSCNQWNACGYPSCTFNRAGWCPGEISCHDTGAGCDQDLDLTSSLPPGGTYDVQFRTLDPTPGGSWSNSLTVYWYETP